jgi:drug/metabolite transporter (DMT)-like permease
MDKQNSGDKIFLAGMILSMTCWGFSWTSGKILSFYGTPLTISALRFALTFISLLAIVLYVRSPFRIERRGLFDLSMASLLISVYTFLFFKGLTTGMAGAGGVLVTVLNPIISYGIMLLLQKRRPSMQEGIGLALGLIAGVILLKLFSDPGNILSAGNLYFLLASFCWAVLSIFTSRGTRYGSSIAFSFWMYGISTVAVCLFAGMDGPLITIRNGDATFWLNLFFSATITTSLATTFYFYATSKIGASQASSFIFMVPFSAALGSWIFLQEKPQLHTIIGGILGIAAVYILNKKKNSRSSTA